jgi:hypothetical protein
MMGSCDVTSETACHTYPMPSLVEGTVSGESLSEQMSTVCRGQRPSTLCVVHIDPFSPCSFLTTSYLSMYLRGWLGQATCQQGTLAFLLRMVDLMVIQAIHLTSGWCSLPYIAMNPIALVISPVVLPSAVLRTAGLR